MLDIAVSTLSRPCLFLVLPDRILRAVLIEQLFPVFLFSPGKKEIFPNVGNLTEGKIFGTLSISIFGKKKWKIWKLKKKCTKKNGNFGQKVLL